VLVLGLQLSEEEASTGKGGP